MIIRLEQCRYSVKHAYSNQSGWKVLWTCGGCSDDRWLEDALAAWRVASTTQMYVGRIPLTRSNLAKKMVEFKARHLRPLQLHPVQTVRLMCLSGHYVLSSELVEGVIYVCYI